MSVPTHNLYDFVHQATKKQFFLMYFYPWGQRELENVIHYQSSDHHFNGPNGIPPTNRQVLPTISPDSIDYRLAARIQPTILCHDQEPLWFDQYCKDSGYTQTYCDQYYNKFGLKISPYHQTQNLRIAFPESLQKVWVLLHSELNSIELAKYESTGLFVGAYWWSHAMIARDWYRFAEYDTSLQFNDSYDKLFLVYCRDITGWRSYRKEFLKSLDTLNINRHCQFHSFHKTPVGPDASAIYDSDDINRTGISIVLETVVDDRIHLTEKILRPIACSHPFMVAAGPGSLKLLRKYGFKTFSPFIDESYDEIQDKDKRLLSIANEMKRLSELPEDEIRYILNQCQLIAKHNKTHFFSTKFYNIITTELNANVFDAHSRYQGQLDYNSWWQGRRWHHANQHHQFKKFEIEYNPGPSLVPVYRTIRSNTWQE